MNIINFLEKALEEQQDENNSVQIKSTTIAQNIATTHQWFDYTFSSASQGDRRYMEDFLSVTQLAEMEIDLKLEEMTKILYLAIYILGDLLFFFESGSTLVCGLTYNGFTLIGNVGDSRANLFIQSHSPTVLRLNRTHKVTNKLEKERIATEVTKWGTKNLQNLFLSRGLGGFGYCPIVTYEPEISFLTTEDKKGTLLLFSDGVSDILNEKEICFLCLKNDKDLAKIIHDEAYMKSQLLETQADNISIITHELISNNALLTCICDGCGGEEVAKLASTLLPKLVSPDILRFKDNFIPWREIYNNKTYINNHPIPNMKDKAKKLISDLINEKNSLSDTLLNWFELKKIYN